MFKDLKLIIPAVLIFLLALFGIYQLYQKTVVEKSKPEPTPAAQFPNAQEASPTATPESKTVPNSQPATGVTSLPETGGR